MDNRSISPGNSGNEAATSAANPPKLFKIAALLPWVYLILRLGLAFLFVYGGFTKLMDPKAFARLISHYDLLPEGLLPFAAIGLPVLETAAGIALALDIKGSLAVISGLLVFFVLVLWYGVLRDLSIDCGCFGAEEIAGHNSLAGALRRDIALIGVAVFLYIARWVGFRTNIPVWNKRKKEEKRR